MVSQGSHRANLVNVLEEQVLQEAERQIQRLPESQQQRLNAVDVAAYVLNRMYPMYATNRDGWGFQREKALRRVCGDLSLQVGQAIAKLKQQPARGRHPLPPTVEAQNALIQLRRQLNRPELTWVELPNLVAQLQQAAGYPQAAVPQQGSDVLAHVLPLR